MDLPPDYYCPEHAKKNGFCWGCGSFWAGIEDFDFSPSIFCPNCEENIERAEDDFNGDYFDYLEYETDFLEL